MLFAHELLAFAANINAAISAEPKPAHKTAQRRVFASKGMVIYMKKIIAILSALFIITTAFSGCGKIQTMQIDTSSEGNFKSVEDDTKEVPVYSEKEINALTPKYVKYSKTVEAESGTLKGNAKVSKKVKGYKGKGYVEGLSSDGKGTLSVKFSPKIKQYYDITLRIMTKNEVVNAVAVNGNEIKRFASSGSGKFETVSFKNQYIDEDSFTVSVVAYDGEIAVDNIKVEASDDISKLSFEFKNKPKLINKSKNKNTLKLYNSILKNYGKKILSGQYASVGTNNELELIYKTTGKYPAIRCGDMLSYTSDSLEVNETEQAIEWAKKGGIVSYMWHWESPEDNAYYADETSFDLSKAVTDKNIAELSIKEIEKLQKDGKISKECVELVKDIDTVSKQLLRLKELDIPVLWRPLHDASRKNAGFWWGAKGFKSYNWLWRLMYERQTKYFKLDNLIWVWSAQSKDWYVGDKYCDIISADIYDDGSESSQIESFLSLYDISKNKPITLSECANTPDISNMVRDKAMWSWFGVWSGNYIMNDDGSLSEKYITKDRLIEVYNNNKVITLNSAWK